MKQRGEQSNHAKRPVTKVDLIVFVIFFVFSMEDIQKPYNLRASILPQFIYAIIMMVFGLVFPEVLLTDAGNSSYPYLLATTCLLPIQLFIVLKTLCKFNT